MDINDLMPQIISQIQKGIHEMYVSVLQEHYPDVIFSADEKNITVLEEDADTQQKLDIYSGKRKRKPLYGLRLSAMDSAIALMRQEDDIQEGTLHTKYLTSKIHEEVLSRISIPGSIQKYLSPLTIGGE